MQPNVEAYSSAYQPRVFRHSARHSRDLAELLAQYDGDPLEISFRSLVGVLPADESTHGIFPYPARLLRHIPRMLLSTKQVLDDVDYVIDPFCGSGTVLLEAQNRGIPSVGIDQNPIAALISRVKTTPLSEKQMESRLAAVLARARRYRSRSLPAEYLRRWYPQSALSGISRLARAISHDEDPAYRDFLALALALTARKMSLADPRIPVPVRRQGEGIDLASASLVWKVWQLTGHRLMDKVSRLRGTHAQAFVVHGDARKLAHWTSPHLGQQSLVITSPPYGAAQKYVRSTSLEAGWLGYATDKGTIGLERSSVGREHLSPADRKSTVDRLNNRKLSKLLQDISSEHPVRGSIYTNYFLDMQTFFNQCSTTDVNCQRLVVICGTNTVRGKLIKTHEYLSDLAEQAGFKRTLSLQDPIRGRTLLTVRKSDSMPAPAEYVEIFERI